MHKSPRMRRALIASVGAALVLLATPSQAAITADWSGYLFAPAHSSYNAAATAITTANAATIKQYWQWKPAAPTMPGQPGPGVLASPTVVGGHVYVGADTGVFYALDLATKRVLWQRFLGFVASTTCRGSRGFTSTATVAPDPTRAGQLTVYVAAADGYLYALRASDGATVWRAVVAIPSSTKNDYYNWGSPAVANGKIYMGIASECDVPLVRGGVKGYSQSTGALIGTYYSVPPGQTGATVWSSVAVNSGGDVFATTGNGSATQQDGQSVVRLNGTTMARVDGWKVPANQAIFDSDFGASPTLFSATLGGTATPMIGACNKNGVYYALRQQSLASGPVWQRNISQGSPSGTGSCLAAAIWNAQSLFVAGSPTMIGGTSYPGAIRRLDPATGAIIWERGLFGTILGSPSLNGSGIIAAGTYNTKTTNFVYLINRDTGAILRSISTLGAQVFGQPVFADNYLLIPTNGAGLLVYKP